MPDAIGNKTAHDYHLDVPVEYTLPHARVQQGVSHGR